MWCATFLHVFMCQINPIFMMMEDLFFYKGNFIAFKSALTVILNSLIRLRNGLENH